MSEEIRSPGSKYLDNKKNAIKKNAESAINDFKSLLVDKTHPDNQTTSYQNNVISILNRLLVAADELDTNNPGEGIFGLIVLCLRSILKIKDDNVRLEVEILNLKREIERIKKQKT